MKKMFTLLMVLALVLCAATTVFADDVTLDVIICQYGPNTTNWFERGGTGMDGSNFVEKFEAANPGVKLNLDTFSEFLPDNLLMPVKDYISDELFADFFPAFMKDFLVDGEYWAVPDLASARVLYYNVDLLEEAGVEVPTTWAELEDAAQAIIDFYDGEVYPWGIDMTTDEGQAAFTYYTWGNGGGFIDENGEWTLNSDENVEAIEFAIGLVNAGYTNPNPATQTRYDLQDMLASGKLAMMIGPNQIPTYIKEKGGEINVATASIPVNEGKTPAAFGVKDVMMAFRDDSAADQAARNEAISKFMKFFYDPANYVGWVSMEDFLPAVNSSVEALVKVNPSFEFWLDVLDTCKFYPSGKAEWAQVRQGVTTVEQNALTGADVRAELDALQAEITGK